KLNDEYGVGTKLSGKLLSVKHPARERVKRANKVAADYEMEGLQHVFARQIEREQEHERAISRNEGTQRTVEKLYQSSHERGNGERSHDTQSIESDSRKIGQSHEQHAINFEHARQDVRRKRREFACDYDKWTTENTKKKCK